MTTASVSNSLPVDGGVSVLVGTLGRVEGGFVFAYAKEFLDSGLPLLPDFPRPDGVHRSRTLWPFFAVRLPPVDRQDVQVELERRSIDKGDTIHLLGSLGRKVISSPYELTPAGGRLDDRH
ncbi:MAG: HipA N-terminal domain-containing protein [Vicinamibacteria bacterium]